MKEGNFPAGGVVVKHDHILASEVSSPYPGLFHADSKAVVHAYNTAGLLQGATLYIGLQSCLMCTGVAYWAGIRRIVYAVPKMKVSGLYYETPQDTRELIKTFNEKIALIHLEAFEEESLAIIRQWEKQHISSRGNER